MEIPNISGSGVTSPWYWPRPEEIIAANQEQEKEMAEKSFLLEILKEHVDNTEKAS